MHFVYYFAKLSYIFSWCPQSQWIQSLFEIELEFSIFPLFFEKSFYTTLLVNEWDENVRKHDGEKVRHDGFKYHYDFEPIVQVPKISRSISTLYSRMSQMQNGQLDGTTTAKSFLDLNWPSTTGTKALSNRICAYFSDLGFSSIHRYEVMK